MAFLSIKTIDFLMFLVKAPENKKNHFIRTTWIKGDKFDHFLLGFNIKIRGKRDQIGVKKTLKYRFHFSNPLEFQIL